MWEYLYIYSLNKYAFHQLSRGNLFKILSSNRSIFISNIWRRVENGSANFLKSDYMYKDQCRISPLGHWSLPENFPNLAFKHLQKKVYRGSEFSYLFLNGYLSNPEPRLVIQGVPLKWKVLSKKEMPSRVINQFEILVRCTCEKFNLN